MLAPLGLLTVVVLLAASMSKRVSPLVALLLVPTTAALVGGFGLDTADRLKAEPSTRFRE
jgi:CitMHS family citrate-Mg2+:H+ or citrate-Ca2+:H+ symporter